VSIYLWVALGDGSYIKEAEEKNKGGHIYTLRSYLHIVVTVGSCLPGALVATFALICLALGDPN
jgi:hypothetical protein